MRRTLIVIFATILPELFGLNLLGEASYFLQMAGMEHTMSFIMMILGVILGLLANFTSFYTLLKFGRRILTNVTLAIVTVTWLSVGIAGCFPRGDGVANYTAAGMMIVIVVSGVGAWPASYVVTAETSSLRLRSKTQGISWLLGGIGRCAFDVTTPFLYNKDAADLGSKTGFVYFGTAIVATVISFFFVPELKGRSTVEIDRMFEQRLPTRQFRKYQKVSGSGSDDALPLHRDLDSGILSTAYDAGSLQDDLALAAMPSTSTGESFEPLRKRPTF